MTRWREVDDTRLLGMLWNQEQSAGTRPGPRSQLTLAMIVEAGIAVADDRDGPALSMRLVADRLGCTPMALYSYVDSKETLLRLMYDAAHAQFGALDGRSSPDVRQGEERLHAWARSLTDLYARHYWLAELSWARPVLGPNEQEVLESLLGCLRPLNIPAPLEATVASTVLTLCRQTGRLVADARHAVRVSGVDDEQWWQRQTAARAKVAPDFTERFPLSTSLQPSLDSNEAPIDPSQGYLERSARAQLRRAVHLVTQGAAISEAD